MAPTDLAVAASSWAVLMGISPVLQIRRMLRERSSRAVSVGYFTILLIFPHEEPLWPEDR